jgi:hypothetical protein
MPPRRLRWAGVGPCWRSLTVRMVVPATHQHATAFTSRGNPPGEYLNFYGLAHVLEEIGGRGLSPTTVCAGGHPANPLPSQQPLRARSSSLHVLVIRHNPNTLDHPLFLRRPEFPPERRVPMGKVPRIGYRQRISRLGEKSLTRRLPLTLRSRQSEKAGTPTGFILIHGATDANGR